jgi:dTDP-4-amino-4,6-dideoxygalactose transaminase
MINVTKTYLPNKKKYQSYVDTIYSSGWVTNNGALVQELAERLRDYLGLEDIVLVSNGTVALEVAYRLLGMKDDVLTTPFSFVATTSSLVSNGLRPVYSDIHPETLNIDPIKLRDNLSGNESGIVATHVFGNACDISAIEAIANANRIKVVYDAAHCFGVEYKGKSILGCGDISTISFHATKLFHTIEGGAIVVNNPALREEARFRINFGIDGVDSVKALGTNAKMNEFEAAMGLCVLDDIDLIFEERSEIASYYFRLLEGFVQFQSTNPESTTNYGYFPVLYQSEHECLTIMRSLREMNIFPRRYFYPSLDTLPYHITEQCMPVSRDVSSRIMALPIYPGLKRSEQNVIVNTIKKGLKLAHGQD